ncbi:MAG: hypothetical protein HY659_14310 [Rhizobiales bacterium]|nr:hypothetical protein [Hyphomicrobiales bacterium]
MITMSRLSVMAAAGAVAFYLGGILPAASQTSAPAAPAAAAKPATTASKKTDASTKKSETAPKVRTGPHVYLLRGLMNIFSLGMDDLAEKLTRRGVYATLHNHAEWQSLSDQIAAQYKAGNHSSIVLVGHSLGADAVMLMGAYLGQKGVPVSLIVPFDGTASYPATSNVSRVMNLTQRDYARMTRGPGFRGELQNIDVSKDESIGHISIDKSARLHAMVVNKILGVTGRGSPAPAKDPSASSSGAKSDSASASQASSSSAKPATATSVAR